ncbi:hypothetical protein GQ42DRAFT_46758 [Ramicandelaber brevisporus]|nr:hypothetical protein GQ42DRAFT_46758 [Ramicandelaber brevisporus]
MSYHHGSIFSDGSYEGSFSIISSSSSSSSDGGIGSTNFPSMFEGDKSQVSGIMNAMDNQIKNKMPHRWIPSGPEYAHMYGGYRDSRHTYLPPPPTAPLPPLPTSAVPQSGTYTLIPPRASSLMWQNNYHIVGDTVVPKGSIRGY